ncbi:hypothetical protein [Bartonella schoenbuchensis]
MGDEVNRGGLGEAREELEWMDVGWLLRGRLVSVEGRLSLRV